MNKYQLGLLRTGDLIQLKNSINEELRARRRLSGMSKRSSTPPIAPPTNKEISKYNSENVVSIPGYKSRKHTRCAAFLPALIKQDWSEIYSCGDSEQKYYVYAHVDPRKKVFCVPDEAGGNYGGMPIYIGKGTGGRAFDLKRNQGHGIALREILASGNPKESIVKILFDGLNEAKAFEIEAKLIYFFGTIYDKDSKKYGALLNLDMPKIPKFVGVMIEPEKRAWPKFASDESRVGK